MFLPLTWWGAYQVFFIQIFVTGESGLIEDLLLAAFIAVKQLHLDMVQVDMARRDPNFWAHVFRSGTSNKAPR